MYRSLFKFVMGMLFYAALTNSTASAGDKAKKTNPSLDDTLRELLIEAGFTGTIDKQLEARLGRPLNAKLADLGRNLFFDPILSLRGDNSCAGCHAPQFGFGDSQSIAIGIQNNNFVGLNRTGPRNQRRSPMLVNTAFFPTLMWNSRFLATSGDPFDNSLGFAFPDPEGITKFLPNDPEIPHLLTAQAHIPPTELVEIAGFRGVVGAPDINPLQYQFDDGIGILVPGPDSSGFRNEPIRQRLLERLNAEGEYVARFMELFPSVAGGGPITFTMIGAAIAEFEFALTFADAPLDEFVRGKPSAMTASEKRGAVLFFGQAQCVACHAVSGLSNEMFSDFQQHRLGVPQIAPVFGIGTGNVIFDGLNSDEDFGLEQITHLTQDRYKFRTSPLRNVGLQPTFFHNGCFTRLEDAVRHHLDAVSSAQSYDPVLAGVDGDLDLSSAPKGAVLADLDPLVATPLDLSNAEIEDLVQFLRTGLLDKRATPNRLQHLIPNKLPSGLPVHEFQK